MFKVLFGDLRSGRLKRLPYAGYWILLIFVAIAIGLGIGMAVGTSEQVALLSTDSDMGQVQAALLEDYGGTTLIGLAVVFGVLAIAVIFGHLNLQAKRLRDMGLPGWLCVAAIFAISLLISAMLSDQVVNVFNIIVFLALLLIPSDMFARGGGSSGSPRT